MLNDSTPQSRRAFAHTSVGAALATLGAGQIKSEVVKAAPAPPSTKTKIRIGTRISPAWLRSANDADLRFLKQIGVDALDIELVMVQGYRETGSITGQALRELTDRFGAV